MLSLAVVTEDLLSLDVVTEDLLLLLLELEDDDMTLVVIVVVTLVLDPPLVLFVELCVTVELADPRRLLLLLFPNPLLDEDPPTVRELDPPTVRGLAFRGLADPTSLGLLLPERGLEPPEFDFPDAPEA